MGKAWIFRVMWLGLVMCLGVAAVGWGAEGMNGAAGEESVPSTPWALDCAPSATIRHAPLWFKGFGPTRMFGEVRDLAVDEPGIWLVQCGSGEVELALGLGFCVDESWTSADLDLELWPGPLGDADVSHATLALLQPEGGELVELPSTLVRLDKYFRLISDAFPLAPYQDPMTGEIEALLKITLEGPESACDETGGNGVSVRRVSLGVPSGG